MSFDFSFMLVALKAALKATPISLLVAFVPFVFGILLGTPLAVARIFKMRILGKLSQAFVVIIKGVPIVVILFIVYFLVNLGFDNLAIKFHWSLRAKNINAVYIVFVALSIFAVANISEAIRGALSAVNAGQYEAAYSVGLTRGQALKRIVFPQALPIAVPVLCNALIGLVKASSLAYLVSVVDLLDAAIITANTNYKFLEVYVAAALIYWAITIIIERTSLIIEKRLGIYIGRELI